MNGIHWILKSDFVDGAAQVSSQPFFGSPAALELQLKYETSWRWKKRNRKNGHRKEEKMKKRKKLKWGKN